jgi:Flp pilus assembly protein TadG
MRRLKSFWSNTSGNIAMMMAIGAVPLCLGVGAAVDMSRAHYTRSVLQGAADAAAIAGGTSKDKSDAAINSIVQQYLKANHAENVLEYVTAMTHTMDMGRGTFTVAIDGTIPTSFMAIAGFADLSIGARSEVNVGSQALEMVLVLDNTGSMAGVKIDNLKSAATNLVNIIQNETSDYADVKMAVVPFAEYVNVGVVNQTAAWVDDSTLAGGPFAGCVGSRAAPLDLVAGTSGGRYPALTGQPCNVELLPLTTDLNAVKARIAMMVSTGATYIPTGLIWGWNVIDAQQPYTQGRTNTQLKAVNGRKAIVLMTDGENTISPSGPTHDGRDTATSNTNLAAICESVKGDDVEIFTVSFMVPSLTIKDILENCASTPTKYFDADNFAELTAAFSQIARELAAVRLTQ